VAGVASLAQPVPFQRSTSDGTPGAWPTAYTLAGERAAAWRAPGNETQHYDEEIWILESRPIRVKISLS
jgi:hypothetical protein